MREMFFNQIFYVRMTAEKMVARRGECMLYLYIRREHMVHTEAVWEVLKVNKQMKNYLLKCKHFTEVPVQEFQW